MDYINIPCPKCYKFQMLSMHGVYICVIPGCTFCCTESEYEDKYGKKLKLVENIDSIIRLKKGSLDTEFELKPVNTVVTSDIHESENYNFDKLVDNYTPSNLDNCENKDGRKESENSIIDKPVYTDRMFENIDIIDLSDEIKDLSAFENLFPEEFQILTSKEKTKVINPKRKSLQRKQYPNFIDTTRQTFSNPLDKLSFSFWKFDNKIFNWLRMPYFFKTHSKIVRIFLLHLNVFKFKDHESVDALKNDYNLCETLANQFRVERIKPLCYHFLQKMFNFVDKIPNRVLVDKEIDERVLCLLKVLFAANDQSCKLKFDCSVKVSCSSCKDSKKSKHKEYFLTIGRPSTLVKVNNNKLNYNVKCLKCKNKASKTIIFEKVPQFVILHFPKGLKNDINRFDGLIDSCGDGKLSVVAVVEIGSKYPFVEWPENPISQMSYDVNPTTMDTRARPSYCVHFRNTNGWYSLNGYKPFLCQPNDSLSVSSLNDVRFIILGTVSNHREFRNQFSIEEFIKNHEMLTRKNYESCFTKMIAKSLPKKVKTVKRKYNRKQPGPDNVNPKRFKTAKKINSELIFEPEIPLTLSARLESLTTDASNNMVDKQVLSASNTSSSEFGRNLLPESTENHENYLHLSIISKNKVPIMDIDDYIHKTREKMSFCSQK